MSILIGKRPLIFAHRGADLVAPENTIPAFQAAERLGADGVELDVQLSRDGQLVICHDFNVRRMTGHSGRVHSMTLAQLRSLDAGYRFGPAFRGTRIPTLGEVFAALRPQTLVDIEIKANPIWHPPAIEEKLAAFLRERRLASRVLLSSFAPFALRRMRHLVPGSTTALLCTKYLFLPYCLPEARRTGAEIVFLHRTTVNEHLVSVVRRAGFHVGAWTVNDEEEMRRFLRFGVEIIITDRPERLRKIVAAMTDNLVVAHG